MTDERTYSLDELSTLVDLPKRTIRYYIQVGLLDRPVGETRAAYYTREHLERLLTIRKWSGAGLSLERIRELLCDEDAETPPLPKRRPGTVEVWSHLLIAPGVELHIEPGQAGLTAQQVRAFLREAMAIYNKLTQEDKQ